MNQEYVLKKLSELHSEGNSIAYSHEDNRLPIAPNPYSKRVNRKEFEKWKSNCIRFLERILEEEDYQLIIFKNKLVDNIVDNVYKGLGILESIIENIEDYIFNEDKIFIEKILQASKINETVFISYSTQNKDKCYLIKEQLNKIGLDTFLAHESISISDEWEEVIFKQLKESDIVVALLSTEFKKSDYCSQEIGMALQKGSLIIPLSIDGCESFGFLKPYQSKPLEDISQMNKAIFKKYPFALIDIQLNRLKNTHLDWNNDKFNYLLELMHPHFEKFNSKQIQELVKITLINNKIHGEKGYALLKEFHEIHKDKIPKELEDTFKKLLDNIQIN